MWGMSTPEYGCQLLKAVVSYNASHMWLNIFDMIFSVVIFDVLMIWKVFDEIKIMKL